MPFARNAIFFKFSRVGPFGLVFAVQAATCGHLPHRPLAATCGHLRPLAANCGHLQPLAATCPTGHLRPLEATCGHLRPLAATCGHLRPLRPLAATCGHLRPLAATCGHLPWRPLAATCRHSAAFLNFRYRAFCNLNAKKIQPLGFYFYTCASTSSSHFFCW